MRTRWPKGAWFGILSSWVSEQEKESLSWEDSWGTLLSEPRERTKSAKWKVSKVYENHFICWYLLVVLSQIKKVEDLQKQQTVKRLDALYHVNSTRCTDSVLQSITRRVRLVALLSISFYLLWGCPRIHWGCFYWIIANYSELYRIIFIRFIRIFIRNHWHLPMDQ